MRGVVVPAIVLQDRPAILHIFAPSVADRRGEERKNGGFSHHIDKKRFFWYAGLSIRKRLNEWQKAPLGGGAGVSGILCGDFFKGVYDTVHTEGDIQPPSGG